MNIELQKQLIAILREEVKPALGCTEPGAVALAAAKAREFLNEPVEACEILVSPNIYKNGMGVGIPGAGRTGLMIAACMGLVSGNSSAGLNVLESVAGKDISEAEALMDSGKVSIAVCDTQEKVYVDAVVKGKNHWTKVVTRGRHDQIAEVLKDGNSLFHRDIDMEKGTGSGKVLGSLTVEQLIREIEQLPEQDILFLLEGLQMNIRISEEGLKNKLGAGVGHSLGQAQKDGMLADDVVNRAVIMTASASDARMSGLKLPVMSSNGSGNHGLTAILPIAAYNEKFPQSDERLSKALAISHLVTAYIKNHIGRLSPVCGCGVAASTGAAAAITWLMGLSYRQIEGAISNMIGNLSGMICDGAKAGCAYKLASAAGAAIQSAIAAKYDAIIPNCNGIIGKNVESSIKNLGIVSTEGMASADKVIIGIMDGCCS
ncbi:MAG TPA: L-serine ammonia-lyase, iron-sulfur-dependent, subunit alpha [Clostridia bacterium]|nr:L-serine ammonia-lyase, iron-sulfur-dependent, subunit alpha [Clostridia bacterium]